MTSKTRQLLTREANRLARESYDDGVTYDRLVAIRDRLAEIDAALHGGV
jgi:hypothetical protein